MAKKSHPEAKKIGSLLRSARDAIKTSRADAAGWVGVSEGTVQNWEEAASPNALRLLLYVRDLCQRSPLACEYVMLALGVGEGPSGVDPELERKLAIVRQAHGHESAGIRAMFSALEVLLSENRQKNTA